VVFAQRNPPERGEIYAAKFQCQQPFWRFCKTIPL